MSRQLTTAFTPALDPAADIHAALHDGYRPDMVIHRRAQRPWPDGLDELVLLEYQRQFWVARRIHDQTTVWWQPSDWQAHETFDDLLHETATGTWQTHDHSQLAA